MTTKSLGPAERAVYELAEHGALDAAHAALYRRPISALARMGLLTRTEDGGYEAVRAATDKRPTLAPTSARRTSEPPPPSTPKPEPLETLVVRVPPAWLEALEAQGPNKSEAARQILGRALAAKSGSRRAAG